MGRGNYSPETLRDLRADLQDVFLGNDKGKRVLQFLMVEMGLFEEVISEEEVALHNYGVRLLNLLGVYEPWQIRGIVQKLSELPRSQPGEKKKGKDMLGGKEENG